MQFCSKVVASSTSSPWKSRAFAPRRGPRSLMSWFSSRGRRRDHHHHYEEEEEEEDEEYVEYEDAEEEMGEDEEDCQVCIVLLCFFSKNDSFAWIVMGGCCCCWRSVLGFYSQINTCPSSIPQLPSCGDSVKTTDIGFRTLWLLWVRGSCRFWELWTCWVGSTLVSDHELLLYPSGIIAVFPLYDSWCGGIWLGFCLYLFIFNFDFLPVSKVWRFLATCIERSTTIGRFRFVVGTEEIPSLGRYPNSVCSLRGVVRAFQWGDCHKRCEHPHSQANCWGIDCPLRQSHTNLRSRNVGNTTVCVEFDIVFALMNWVVSPSHTKRIDGCVWTIESSEF